MGVTTILSAAILGLKVECVSVEADVSNGLPIFHMVGYLSSEVKEAAERVKTAIKNSGLEFPAKKIIINLAPATVRKRGAAFDLPIALAILASLGQLDSGMLKNMLVAGELSLDGRIRGIPGVLPIVSKAREEGVRCCILPKSNAREGALVEGIEIIGANSLREVYDHFTKKTIISPTPYRQWQDRGHVDKEALDYQDICGQEVVKRAIEVAVAGGHNLLLIGPPGSGKSMMAKRIPTILPRMTQEERMELTKIYSILGLVDEKNPLIGRRPFREIHHTATKAALIGGGLIPKPGEISLAHQGVLFFDELPEFQKQVLEVLRQPLEDKKVCIARAQGGYVFPANFMLVAAMNPCPCGCYPDLNRCTCTPGQIQHYLGKISQPFLERMDICVEAPKIEYKDLHTEKCRESSADIRKRVCAARKLQTQRYGKERSISNAMLGVEELKRWCRLGTQEEAMMETAFSRLGLTARTYHKILKVARTIADLDGKENIEMLHLQEAIGYRAMDKKYWGR